MSALINPTWWLLCGALAICLVARDPRAAVRRALALVTTTPVLVVIACAAVGNLGVRAMLGHALPSDFVQEIVAARSVRAHTTLYPADVNGAVETWAQEHPPRLTAWLPGRATEWLQARQRQGRDRLVAQAHPPTLVLAIAPAILVLGPFGGYWAVTLASIAGAALTGCVLVSAYAPQASARERVLAVLALASWQPALATIRLGQVSVVIGALLVLGWRQLRRGEDARAGVAIGIAAGLKLFPLVLLVSLAVRRRRAFTAAAVTVSAAAVLVTLFVGADAWAEYAAAARLIARSFEAAPNNLSIVVRLAALFPRALVPLLHAAAAITAVSLTLALTRGAQGLDARLRLFDVEFASFVTLALLLSPVAWHHYAFMLALPIAVLIATAWTRENRASLAAVLALAVVLSMPDDAWQMLWRGMPMRLASLVSSSFAVVLLWAGLLRIGVRVRAGVANQPALTL